MTEQTTEQIPCPPAPRTEVERLAAQVAELQGLLEQAEHAEARAIRERNIIRERVSEPYGCRYCGEKQRHHGRRYIASVGMHSWEKPDDAQVMARMLARRAAQMPLLTEGPERGKLWSLLDWSLWGAGMGDVFREPLADAMVSTIPAELVAQAEQIMAEFIERRQIEKTGVTIYQEQRDELERLRDELARAQQPSYSQRHVWSVWREDQPIHAFYATEDDARQGSIDCWEEDEPVCPDYSWKPDGPRLELLVGGEASGVYISRNDVFGAPGPALPWAAAMSDDDLHEFLGDLVSAAMGRWRSEPEVPDRTVLADIEKACAQWRTPGQGLRSDEPRAGDR